MKRAQGNLRALVSGIGLFVAIGTAVAVPAGYYLVARSHVEASLAFEARLKANRLAKYIYANTELWQYQTVRLAEIIEVPEATDGDDHQAVFDATGRLVLESGQHPEFPAVTQTVSIVVGGQPIGWIETSTSFLPQLLNLGLVSLFSALLGFGMFFALRVLPLRVLDRTLLALAAQTLRFESALDNMSQGLCMLDSDRRLVVSNQRFTSLFGIPSGSVRPGMSEAEIMGLLGSGARKFDDGAFRATSGNVISVQREPMANGGEVVTYEDVTERRRAETKIAHMARHDALTDLPNRLLLRERMEKALSDVAPGGTIAVFCLDIDHFKVVNDTFGHAAGDVLLREITARLVGAVRTGDTVARLGGDEFAIVQTAVSQPENSTALAVRLVELIATPFDLDGNEVVVGTSIGIALSPGDGSTPGVLLKNADLALYRAKADGRGTHHYFEAGMDARIQARRALEFDLRHALRLAELQLYFQPIVDVRTEAILGFEALLRWRHPVRGLVQPNEFIPLAEDTGLIISIGEWIVAEACREAMKWPGDIKVAVNLSPVQFRSRNLVPVVQEALKVSGLAPGRLELEITESVLLQDNDNVLDALHRLRALGARISMDDFGTGYSSLSYLRKFPFDKIKIDRSFVSEMTDRDDSLAIVRAISAIGSSLGMLTTAEGVETREQFERVKTEGCTEVQGYLFGKPQPACDLALFFAESAKRTSVVNEPDHRGPILSASI